jgi:VRR-NUC domain
VRLRASEVAQLATEHQETAALVQWLETCYARWPDLLYCHNPNEGKRSYAVAARMKSEGMKPGVPDLTFYVGRGGYKALCIEMKRVKGGKASPAQTWWIERLNANGYRAVVCYGQDEAKAEIERYMSLEAGQ